MVRCEMGEVSNLDVEKNHRRKGVATMLMRCLLKDYGHEHLSLMAEPEDGIPMSVLKRFYRSLGFKSAPPPEHDYMSREPNVSL